MFRGVHCESYSKSYKYDVMCPKTDEMYSCEKTEIGFYVLDPEGHFIIYHSFLSCL